MEIEVPRPYTEHAPRSTESTSTSFPADDASHSLTACIEVALNDNSVNCDLAVDNQTAGGWESGSFVSSRRVQAKSRSQAERVSSRLSTSPASFWATCRAVVQLRRRRHASCVPWLHCEVRRGSRPKFPPGVENRVANSGRAAQ